jgi:hypothetical protein
MAAHLELMRELSIEDGPYGVIEQTTADEAAPAVAADSGGRRGSPRLGAMAAWLQSALFRQAAPAPVGWRKILGGAAFLMVGAAAHQSCQKSTLGEYSHRHAWWTVKIPCGKRCVHD